MKAVAAAFDGWREKGQPVCLGDIYESAGFS